MRALGTRRTDLALEAHALYCTEAKAAALDGVTLTERCRQGCAVTTVRVEHERAARQLGKAVGCYVTLDLRALRDDPAERAERVAGVLAAELRTLMGHEAGAALVVGLGNRAVTPDVIGPLAASAVPATRHLRGCGVFSALASVGVLTPGVLGMTGMEAAEQVRGAIEAVHPSVVIAVDALASQRLARVCTTIQLSDTGIVPGSGVGNHRGALTRETLGVPVLAVGVPTVVDAATLTLDVLEEAGASCPEPEALRGHEGVMVTLRDIDKRAEELARIVGYGISLALFPSLSLSELRALME